MIRLRHLLYFGAMACAVSATLVYAQAQRTATAAPESYAASKERPTYGHDSGGMRFSPLTQITPANVGTLEVAWVYHLKPEGFVAPAFRGAGEAAPAPAVDA